MNLKFKRNELVFLIVVFIIAIKYINGVNIGNTLANVTSLLWIIYSFGQKKKKEYKNIARINLKIVIAPIIAMVLYTSILWIIKPPSGAGTTISYFTRLLSTNSYLVLQFLFVFSAFGIFGENTIELICNGLIANYTIISVIPALIWCGPIAILKYIFSFGAVTEGVVKTYLEVHDLTFALGILFIYYFFDEYRHRTKKNIKRLFLMGIYIFMGYKRVELLAILLVFLYYYIIDINFKKFKQRTAIITGVVLVCSLIFVSAIYSGFLDYIALKFGIEFNYRLDTWAYWAERSSFSLSFPGLGTNFVDKDTYLMQLNSGIIQNGHVLIAGMHSDLFKKYVELGFIPFSLWITYILYFKTTYLNKKFGKVTSDVYLLITLYVVVIYLTDNIYNYCICNACYIVVPMVMCLRAGYQGKQKQMYQGYLA